jgi:hypothetical protein
VSPNRSRRRTGPAAVFLVAALASAQTTASAGAAAPSHKVFADPEDQKLDASEWLLDRKGFLPVPIVITEPAVGYGGGIGLVFFRGSLREMETRSQGSGKRFTPPGIFGVAAAGTENGTAFGGAGARLSFKDDRWRYVGGAAYTDANLTFYGIGGEIGTGDEKIGFNLDGWLSSQQILRRIGNTNQHVAFRWVWLDLQNQFDDDRPEPVLTDQERSARDSGLGLSWEYDSRDSIFTATRGVKGAVESLFYDPSWGGENTFQVYRAQVFGYLPAGTHVILGGRLDGRTARGDVPFYQLPYIDLRGIPALRYQDENAAMAEAEIRWLITPRWSAVGFAGIGRAWGRIDGFDEASDRDTQGLGFRYLLARRLRLATGVDYAVGPDDHAVYLQVGSAWR